MIDTVANRNVLPPVVWWLNTPQDVGNTRAVTARNNWFRGFISPSVSKACNTTQAYQKYYLFRHFFDNSIHVMYTLYQMRVRHYSKATELTYAMPDLLFVDVACEYVLASCSGQAISISLNLANHISLLTCPVYFLRNVLKKSILNIKIMWTCCVRWLSRPISS